MHFQGLQTKLIFNLAFILLLAILFTDFVVVRIIERNLIQERIEYGDQLIAGISRVFLHRAQHPSAPRADDSALHDLLDAAGRPIMVHARFTPNGAAPSTFGNLPVDISFSPAEANAAAMQNGPSGPAFLGTTWGVFWKTSKYIAISRHVPEPPPGGAATVILRLDDIYQDLRRPQKLIVFYSLANFLLLLGLGLFRLNRIVLRPIQRFIQMAEELESSDQFPAYPGRRNNEFRRLSIAIQQMVRRIEADKEQIQNSLRSLETAHRELKEAQNEMIRAEKLASVGRLSAGIAHEIGNPIGIVLGYLSLLKNQPGFDVQSRAGDYLVRAETEINRINQIITQLLNFSRGSSAERELVSVNELIEEVGHMLSEQPMMRHVSLKYHLDAGRDRVRADGQQLRQVLVNLLINAADSISFSEKAEPGEIRLLTRQLDPDDPAALQRKPTVTITVADNGTGIAREDMDNIFDPFFTTKEPGKGTGLGLSVSYMIIEQLGGMMDVKSRPQTGTSMILYLPLAEAA